MEHQFSTVTDSRAYGIGSVEDAQELNRRFDAAYPRHRSLAKVEARVRFPYPAPDLIFRSSSVFPGVKSQLRTRFLCGIGPLQNLSDKSAT
jgi:hypothetical protein